jgi:prepilin-type N-terminal cleavage/methylation domain-containing protein/prepilin-type processing-associated H-X9-DG protein
LRLRRQHSRGRLCHIDRAFTLVELLVVIGIIAVLVGILLPVLAGARRQANAVKCATQLREIGNAFVMYAMENRGYFPPSQIQPNPAVRYNIDGVDYPPPGGAFGAYWFNFLAKYVTKSKMGEAAGTNTSDLSQARKTVFWGCPSWDTYRRAASADGLHPTQIGFGMTYWPTPTFASPAQTDYPAVDQTSFIIGWHPRFPERQWTQGRWFKQKVYDRHAPQRALVADSRFWALNSFIMPPSGVLQRQMSLRNDLGTDHNGPGQTFADIYRHGKYPPVVQGQFFSTSGGKIAYNILYCDGHVATTTDWREAFRSVRFRFPG